MNVKTIKKCLDNGIKIYPVLTSEYYYAGKMKLQYLNIEIDMNGKKKLGVDRYKQDDVSKKIYELYDNISTRI
jgi:hypothetical protein